MERMGLPVAVWAPETTQSLEPAKQLSQIGLRRVCWRAWRSWEEAVVVLEFVDPTLRDETAKDGAPGLDVPDGGSAVALVRDAHISESRDGAPGFVDVALGFVGVPGFLLGE